MPPTLYVIRHGETDWNRDGRLQGHRDIPLNATGRAHSREAARRLAGVMPAADLPALDYVASPLKRAQDTMALLRGSLGLPEAGFTVDDRLTELRFGRWEGLTWPQVRAADPAGAAARARHLWDFAPPGGESYAELATRLESWLEDRAAPAVVVTHGGVVRTLLVLLAGVPAHEAGGLEVVQGRVLVLEGGRAVWM